MIALVADKPKWTLRRPGRGFQISEGVVNASRGRRLRRVGLPGERPKVVAVIENACSALSLGRPRRVGDGTVAENVVSNVRAVALVSARPCRIDFADTGVEAVIGERVGC